MQVYHYYLLTFEEFTGGSTLDDSDDDNDWVVSVLFTALCALSPQDLKNHHQPFPVNLKEAASALEVSLADTEIRVVKIFSLRSIHVYI